MPASISFKALFSFSKAEIVHAFSHAQLLKKTNGLKLLSVPPAPDMPLVHGKLLIVTPRSSGKAHARNRIRRQIKSIYFQEQLFRRPQISILLIYKPAMALNFEALRNFLVEALKP